MDLGWTDEEYEEYDGHDLILGTGVPGSKWSGIFMAMGETPSMVNSSNRKMMYGKNFYNKALRAVKTYGWHFGTYWGPYHENGKNFDDLKSMSKKEIMQEISAPFEEWDDRFKLCKSHWFLYDLDYLVELFPKATIIGVYLQDDLAFEWWHFLGGWNIDYPPYTWYKDDTKMKEDIKIGNALLIKFFAERGIPLKVYKDYPKLFEKELGWNIKQEDILLDHNSTPAANMGVYCPHMNHNNTNIYSNDLERINPKGFNMIREIEPI